jgi:hypothetical protein
MRRLVSILVLQMLIASGCAAQSSWSPTVDTFGSSRAQYTSRDMEECRAMARTASGSAGGAAGRGAVQGGLVGAAGGAALGAAFGNAGRGAAVGAAAGGIGRGAQQASASEGNFQRAFSNCMRSRGHNVLN